MKAVVFHGIGDIRLDDVSMPKLKKSTDAVVRITRSAICGTDLHMVRGTMTGMKPGTILGHEAVGIVEELGSDVRNLNVGDRVVIPSTIACGYCSYCRDGYYAQCDNANPKGSQAGTAFFGGPETTGPFDGLQAEYARVPYANVGLVKIPDSVSDDQAVQSVAKAGTLGIIGVYPETMRFFPIGMAMMKNLTIAMGNCNHRKYIPHLLETVASGAFDPYSVITNVEPLSDVIKAYEAFGRREEGWVKVSLVPGI